MIRSFRDKETEQIFRREFRRRFQAIAAVAKRKLDHLHAAHSLSDLAVIPGNRLEALYGDRTENTAFVSMISGGSVFGGPGTTPMMWRSSIITEERGKWHDA